jgi:hypothetical protein
VLLIRARPDGKYFAERLACPAGALRDAINPRPHLPSTRRWIRRAIVGPVTATVILFFVPEGYRLAFGPQPFRAIAVTLLLFVDDDAAPTRAAASTSTTFLT